MRTEYERQEKSADTELTLGMASLLGIFFGLVLLCGVFFGFGYSMGRHKAAVAPIAADSESEAAPVKMQPKPSALEGTNTPATVRPVIETARTPEKPSASSSAVLPKSVGNTAVKGPTQSTGPVLMVQIAAVSRREDAEALVAALRKHSYNASMKAEPQDKLLHVQVGPLPTRDAAKAMRTRLQADGYNAIIKP